MNIGHVIEDKCKKHGRHLLQNFNGDLWCEKCLEEECLAMQLDKFPEEIMPRA